MSHARSTAQAGKPPLIIAAGANFLRAHGSIKYLADALFQRGIDLEIYAPIPRDLLAEIQSLPYKVHSCFEGWIGTLPRIRLWAFRRRIRKRLLSGPSPSIIYTPYYFREAVAMKSARPEIMLISYCPEFYTPKDAPNDPIVAFYAEHANIADLHIEVEPNRAAKRKELLELTHEVVVLPNTLPLAEMPVPAPKGSLARLAGGDLPTEMPILIFTGGLYSCVPFGEIIEAIAAMTQPIYFLAFCHGIPKRIEAFRTLVERRLGSSKGRVCSSVPRRALLSCLHEASAGLVYYPYSAEMSFNQLYCAPTKFFEYLAAGLPVIASANPSLIPIIDGYGLGECAHNDTTAALRDAIERFCSRQDRTSISERAKQAFAEEFCYEKASQAAIVRITEFIENQRNGPRTGLDLSTSLAINEGTATFQSTG